MAKCLGTLLPVLVAIPEQRLSEYCVLKLTLGGKPLIATVSMLRQQKSEFRNVFVKNAIEDSLLLYLLRSEAIHLI